MDAMAARIDALLADASPRRGALSFVVVVPAWGAGAKAAAALEASAFCRAALRVRASEHGFCDGAQHSAAADATPNRHRPSSWDTSVTLLQNDAGARRWPLSSAALDAGFGAALRASMGAAGGKTLEQWERRGPARGGTKQPRDHTPRG